MFLGVSVFLSNQSCQVHGRGAKHNGLSLSQTGGMATSSAVGWTVPPKPTFIDTSRWYLKYFAVPREQTCRFVRNQHLHSQNIPHNQIYSLQLVLVDT